MGGRENRGGGELPSPPSTRARGGGIAFWQKGIRKDHDENVQGKRVEGSDKQAIELGKEGGKIKFTHRRTSLHGNETYLWA